MYNRFLEDELWLIKETKWVKSLRHIRESQFTLGNGYLCSRGILEETTTEGRPGTYIAGLYDKIGSLVDEVVNLPNPVNFNCTINGQKLGVRTMDAIKHRRALNMRKGVLLRQAIFRDVKKRRYEYESIRFISMHDKNVGAMQVTITPLDHDCTMEVNTSIDTSVSNAANFSEGKKRHFTVRELDSNGDASYVLIETLQNKNRVAFWQGCFYQWGQKTKPIQDTVSSLTVKKGQSVTFTKVFYVKHFSPGKDNELLKRDTFGEFEASLRRDFLLLLADHLASWQKVWLKGDVKIEGTADLQKNVRFNIYHMIICAGVNNGFSSIGARTLSGEGYRGHVFWDADIFLLPFYLFTFPAIAKNMLLYRYRRLDQARALAKSGGYGGVRFAWESASTGEEETPEWARDIDGTVTKVHTHSMEQHITADVAYAVYKYFVATDDQAFMEKYGYEMMFETARFWASRVTRNKRTKKYEIKNIIGPDEFHVGVNNNAFTNMMAKWNLLTAHKLFHGLSKNLLHSFLLRTKLGLSHKEVGEWKRIASKIVIPIGRTQIIEQFDGYHKLKKTALTRTDENGIPLMPRNLSAKDIAKTQLIKQADVVMLLFLLDDIFTNKTKRLNYDFYMPRTAHKSSLSASMCALVAAGVGDLHRAYSLFNVSLRADISDLYGNTHEGIHAASLGGTWQVVIFGFAGIKIRREMLWVDPLMPRSWSALDFSLHWKRKVIRFHITSDTIKCKISSRKKDEMRIGIFGKIMRLKSGSQYVFRRPKTRSKTETYY